MNCEVTFIAIIGIINLYLSIWASTDLAIKEHFFLWGLNQILVLEKNLYWVDNMSILENMHT